jgi:hypothetical protein
MNRICLKLKVASITSLQAELPKGEVGRNDKYKTVVWEFTTLVGLNSISFVHILRVDKLPGSIFFYFKIYVC